MTLKEIAILGLLCYQVMDIQDLIHEYPMVSQEDAISESTLRDVVDRLLKSRFVRHASTDRNKVEIRIEEAKNGVIWYTATPQGHDMLRRVRDICERCGLLRDEK